MLCISCNQKVEKETPNGFKFTVVKSGDGVLAKKGEILVFDHLLKDSKDSVWKNTHNEGIPSAFMIQDSAALQTENGMLQMFRMLSKGDSITVTMPITKFFRDIVQSSVPPGMDTSLNISYCIQVNDIMGMEQFRAFEVDLMKKQTVAQVAKDSTQIEKYLAENNIKAQQDTSGLRYVIHTSKGGSKPTVNNCVEVKYRGKLLDNGTVFDQSDKFAFPLDGVIPGWQLAIPMLGVGDSATFYIPSGLAYGPRGAGPIPPTSILVFDVELLGIGGEFDQTTRTCK